MTTSEPVMGAPVTTASLPPDSDPDRHSTVTLTLTQTGPGGGQ